MGGPEQYCISQSFDCTLMLSRDVNYVELFIGHFSRITNKIVFCRFLLSGIWDGIMNQ